MTSNEYPVVLTLEGADAANNEVVDANVTVVNAMFRELLNSGEIAPNALRSYFVDFYLTQALGGGFAQYVYTAADRGELDTYIREGLEAMGAAAHLALFDRTAEAFDALSEEEAEIYLDGEWDAETDGELPESVQAMEDLDAEFEALLETEDITALNAAWLRGQEGLLILAGAELAAHLAARVARVPDLEERRAEAEQAALETAPEFELIIRELCDIAGEHAVVILFRLDDVGEFRIAPASLVKCRVVQEVGNCPIGIQVIECLNVRLNLPGIGGQ